MTRPHAYITTLDGRRILVVEYARERNIAPTNVRSHYAAKLGPGEWREIARPKEHAVKVFITTLDGRRISVKQYIEETGRDRTAIAKRYARCVGSHEWVEVEPPPSQRGRKQAHVATLDGRRLTIREYAKEAGISRQGVYCSRLEEVGPMEWRERQPDWRFRPVAASKRSLNETEVSHD